MSPQFQVRVLLHIFESCPVEWEWNSAGRQWTFSDTLLQESEAFATAWKILSALGPRIVMVRTISSVWLYSSFLEWQQKIKFPSSSKPSWLQSQC